MCRDIAVGDPSRVTMDEFKSIMAKQKKDKQSPTARKDLMDSFMVFDKENDGLIRENDLRNVLTLLGETIDVDDADRLIATVKIDNNGKIKMSDIVDMLLK